MVTQLLIDDLTYLVKSWVPGAKNNYRAKFEKGGNESLRKMLVAMGSLSHGELASERLESPCPARTRKTNTAALPPKAGEGVSLRCADTYARKERMRDENGTH